MSRACRALGATHTQADIARIVESSFEHAARFWGETLFIHRRLTIGHWRQIVEIHAADGPQMTSTEMYPAKRQSDRGMLLTSAYLGNPAVAAVVLGRLLGRIHVIADFDNQPMMSAWARDLRELDCVHIVDRADAAAMAPQVLDAGGAVFMIGEHARLKGRGVSASWLGRDMQAYPTLGLLAARHNAIVVPVACTRESDAFRFEMHIGSAIDPQDACIPPDEIVRKTLAALESRVRKSPEQYLWAMPDQATP